MSRNNNKLIYIDDSDLQYVILENVCILHEINKNLHISFQIIHKDYIKIASILQTVNKKFNIIINQKKQIKYMKLSLISINIHDDNNQLNIIFENIDIYTFLESIPQVVNYNKPYSDVLKTLCKQYSIETSITLPSDITSSVFVSTNNTNFNILKYICLMFNACFIIKDNKLIVDLISSFCKNNKQKLTNNNIINANIFTHMRDEFIYSNHFNIHKPSESIKSNQDFKNNVYIPAKNMYTNDKSKKLYEYACKYHNKQNSILSGSIKQNELDINLFDEITYEKKKYYIIHIELRIINNQICYKFRASTHINPEVINIHNPENSFGIIKEVQLEEKTNNIFVQLSYHNTLIPVIMPQNIASINYGEFKYPAANSQCIITFVNSHTPILSHCIYTIENKQNAIFDKPTQYGYILNKTEDEKKAISMHHDIEKGESKFVYQKTETNIMEELKANLHKPITINIEDNTKITSKKDGEISMKNVKLKFDKVTLEVEELELTAKNSIKFNADKIEFKAKSDIKIDAKSTNIKSGKIDLNASQACKIEGGSITLSSKQKLDIKSSGQGSIDVMKLDIKTKTMLKIESMAVVKIAAQGMLQLEGAMFQLNSNGLMLIKASILLLNAVTTASQLFTATNAMVIHGIP